MGREAAALHRRDRHRAGADHVAEDAAAQAAEEAARQHADLGRPAAGAAHQRHRQAQEEVGRAGGHEQRREDQVADDHLADHARDHAEQRVGRVHVEREGARQRRRRPPQHAGHVVGIDRVQRQHQHDRDEDLAARTPCRLEDEHEQRHRHDELPVLGDRHPGLVDEVARLPRQEQRQPQRRRGRDHAQPADLRLAAVGRQEDEGHRQEQRHQQEVVGDVQQRHHAEDVDHRQQHAGRREREQQPARGLRQRAVALDAAVDELVGNVGRTDGVGGVHRGGFSRAPARLRRTARPCRSWRGSRPRTWSSRRCPGRSSCPRPWRRRPPP